MPRANVELGKSIKSADGLSILLKFATRNDAWLYVTARKKSNGRFESRERIMSILIYAFPSISRCIYKGVE